MTASHTPQPHTVQSHTPRRQTKQRTAVRSALADASHEFVSAQRLHAELQEHGASIGLATVYRNLNDLVDLGDADTLTSPTGEQLFRLCSTEHHHHLICRVCGRTVEIEAPIEGWVNSVSQQYGFTDVEHVVELFGICSDCHRAE